MRIDKVILRSILSTLAAILVMFAIALLALCFIYPSTMMHVTYDLGMDGASVKYAMRSYNRTDEVYYVAFATETAIGDDNDEKIEECGLAFIVDDAFDEYCQTRNKQLPQGVVGSYEQYVYGQISLAQYRQDKKDVAITTAVAALQSGEGYVFPENNAFVALSLTALMQEDTATLTKLKEKMGEIASVVSPSDRACFDALFAMLG